jgi:hypothetical protein
MACDVMHDHNFGLVTKVDTSQGKCTEQEAKHHIIQTHFWNE